MFKRIVKTKTFWAAITAIIVSMEQVFTGQMCIAEAVQLAIPAVMALFLRDGIAKNGVPGSSPGNV